MKRDRRLLAIRLLEERLKSASPADAGKLAKELVRLKDDYFNG